MKSILVAGVLTASFLAGSYHLSHAAPSVCKGLDQAACATHGECAWSPERIAGQTLTKAGTPAKTSQKAHCRLGARKPAETPKQ